MILTIPQSKLLEIQQHAEASYPEEGAGLLIGKVEAGQKHVMQLFPLSNAREKSARHNRYLLTPNDYLQGEKEAARLGLEVLGIFHSHPDHPNLPSEFDREWALPFLSYVITSVHSGKNSSSRSWLLSEDRTTFIEETIRVVETSPG